jgi:hypothetical protein
MDKQCHVAHLEDAARAIMVPLMVLVLIFPVTVIAALVVVESTAVFGVPTAMITAEPSFPCLRLLQPVR